MKFKAVSGIMLSLLLIGMLILTFGIQPVKASGTIYIRADGSVEPSTANITSLDNITYTFTGNINESIVVERDNIVVDGAGYTIQGSGTGISLTGRTNVTIKNMEIKSFMRGIFLEGSSNNTISGNNLIDNWNAICLYGFSNYNTISGNTIIQNNNRGITLYESSNNNVSGNTITNNDQGIMIAHFSNYNTISGNTITNNGRGIHLEYPYYSSNNKIYHNNLMDNTYQVVTHDGYMNIWDDGYPSGGNYWSDYVDRYPVAGELDGSGIWNTPYVIDGSNQDNYPLMEPWALLPSVPTIYVDPPTITGIGTFTININVYDVTDLGCFEFKLWYNTSILDALEVRSTPITESCEFWGPVDENGTFHWDGPPTINDTIGRVWLGTSFPWGQEFTGDGILVTIDFTATGVGSCTSNLNETVLGDSLANPIDHMTLDGSVTVVPGHALTIYSSPTGATFTVDGFSRTTPWSGTYSEGASVSLVMPESHDGYEWSYWQEDGDPNRTRTVTMDTNITLTGVYVPAPEPVGGKATPINIPLNKPETPTLWIWLPTITLSLIATVVYVKKRKRNTEINS